MDLNFFSARFPRSGRAHPVRLVALVALVGALFLGELLVGPHSAGQLRGALNGLGGWAPLVVVVAFALLVCAIVPTPILAGASGLLFGTALGTPVSLLAFTFGGSLALLISRRLARSAVPPMRAPRLQAWSSAIDSRGFLAVLYARIAPGAPFALISYASGLTRVRFAAFVSATLIGAAPRAFAYTALGGSLGDYSSPQAIAAIAVLVAMALAGAAVAWRLRVLALRRRVSPMPDVRV